MPTWPVMLQELAEQFRTGLSVALEQLKAQAPQGPDRPELQLADRRTDQGNTALPRGCPQPQSELTPSLEVWG